MIQISHYLIELKNPNASIYLNNINLRSVDTGPL